MTLGYTLKPNSQDAIDLRGLVGSGEVPVLQNYRAGALKRTRAGLAKVAAGTGSMVIALAGDSTFRGANGNIADTAWGLNSPAVRLAKLLTARGVPASYQSTFCSGGPDTGGAAFSSHDSRVTLTGSWTNNGGPTAGNFPARGPAGASTYQFTFDGVADTADIWCWQFGAAGGFDVTVDGVAVTTGSPVAQAAGPEAMSKKTVTFPATGAGSHTVLCTRTSGQMSIAGVNVYSSVTPACQVWNLGWGGSKASAWAATTPTFGSPGYAVGQSMQPNLVIFNPMINDWLIGAPTNLATYAADLGTFIDAVSPTCDVILKTGLPTKAATQALSTQSPYVAAMIDVALAKGVPYIDTFARAISWEAQATVGFQDTDAYHPAPTGYQDDAGLLYAAIMRA